MKVVQPIHQRNSDWIGTTGGEHHGRCTTTSSDRFCAPVVKCQYVTSHHTADGCWKMTIVQDSCPHIDTLVLACLFQG